MKQRKKTYCSLGWTMIVALALLSGGGLLAGICPDAELPAILLHDSFLTKMNLLIPHEYEHAEKEHPFPVYLLNNGIHLDIMLPVCRTIETPQGLVAIDYSTLFQLDRLSSGSTPFAGRKKLPNEKKRGTVQEGRLKKESQTAEHITHTCNGKEDDWIVIGWGNLEFYRTTPAWTDLTWKNIWRVLYNQEAAVHVYRLGHGAEQSVQEAPLPLSPREFVALYAFIRKSVKIDDFGYALKTDEAGFGSDDFFYHAEHPFSCFYTCNTWIADAIKSTGRSSALWTVVPWFVLYHLDRAQPR